MKTAVVLFNLGGPDRLSAVRPFLKNLFSDSAIIGLPMVLRLPLASLIAWRREPEAQEIYKELGGWSPLLDNTKAQAKALEQELGSGAKVFICMRYWHPMTPEVVAQVLEFKPDQVILLPLYPQFSTTTTGSSLKAWDQEWTKQGGQAPTEEVLKYPENSGFVEAMAQLTVQGLKEMSGTTPVRILFSAHGLPQKIIDQGDPYEREVTQTFQKVVKRLKSLDQQPSSHKKTPPWEARLCYQSKVGPLKWLQPYTDTEIKQAGSQGKSILMVPIAFVSEHSETLVELDIQYKDLAQEKGVKEYRRVPTVGVHPHFIQGLAQLVRDKQASSSSP